ncbi:uncharacterized protein LOC101861404 isoform X2 [Aplysia californica]|uniref:Uncharacterized protein LOC101861404 isoform X2 n=1 Tax=Aplysia californica TaxID=6500 RepID=A0ABM1W306_APLCA|nr:uncharacterized protein LOC101861404 isoform X2 [Aplysia californica]
MAGCILNDWDVVYYLRDVKEAMVEAWQEVFDDYSESVRVSQGDLFEGAPAADAVVSTGNSFGFMDGSVDGACKEFFGAQIQRCLQKIIREDYDGELLVGQAVVMPTYGEEGKDASKKEKAIKYLISAPTVRVPADVSSTANAYLAFRAVILAVRRHNKMNGCEPIKSVLVPGLAARTGGMPELRCAWQLDSVTLSARLAATGSQSPHPKLFNLCLWGRRKTCNLEEKKEQAD